ncbi:MAG: hypothetical protein AB7H90_05320 [Alphaproteobacteria bacterium]
METPNLICESVRTIGETIFTSESMTLIAVAFIVLAVYLLRNQQPTRFDPLRHMTQPPDIEHQPQRGLPPPSQAYANWGAEKDKEKDHAPWDR